MITANEAGHDVLVDLAVLESLPDAATTRAPPMSRVDDDGEPAGAPPELAQLLREHFDFVWRSLRRLGLDAGRADDAAQEVFLIASRKRDRIQAGCERAFLFGTALRVAADVRKSVARRREVPQDEAVEGVDPTPSPEALLDQRRARVALDEILDELPQDLRAIFVLFELEELELREIATMMAMHQGTVASRLRRARALFANAVKRRQARLTTMGGRRRGACAKGRWMGSRTRFSARQSWTRPPRTRGSAPPWRSACSPEPRKRRPRRALRLPEASRAARRRPPGRGSLQPPRARAWRG